ncbi:hypothetical protein PG985_006516 [Apiospora marii]|uniref:uncharacterized protein n=1 Tax=Apiospora marii TaxID=335849 RepID=UPI00312FEE43
MFHPYQHAAVPGSIRDMDMPTEQTFFQFSKLPFELRDLIWSYALPEPRVYEVLDSPSSAHHHNIPSSRLMFADIRNEPPPTLGRVCQDARRAVSHRYKPLVFSGTVKHVDLSRDIILLDSYLQVKRLLKAMRLLSQIDTVRRHATKIALGTSWGLYTGLHLRLFHKSVRTQQNLARFLQHISKFRQMKDIILVVYQRSAFNLNRRRPDRPRLPWQHYDLYESYHYNYNVNYNVDNYFVRRPCHSRLVRYDPGIAKADRIHLSVPQHKQYSYGPLPLSHQVHELKTTFEQWMGKVVEAGSLGNAEPPRLETATLTWIYK